MSRSLRATHVLLLAAMAAGGDIGHASSPPLPDEFLEYLGSWDVDDADWLVASATAVSTKPAHPPAAPTGVAQSTPRSTTAPRGTTTSPAPGTEPKP